MKNHAWKVYLAVNFAALAAYFVFPATGNWIYIPTGLAAAAACAYRGIKTSGRVRLGWWAVGLGIACLSAGDAVYSVEVSIYGDAMPFPSLADAVYLSAYPLISFGIVSFLKARRLPDRDSLLDAVMMATSAGLIAWIFLMQPYAADRSLTFVQQAVSIGYPMVDILMLGVLFRLLLAKGNKGVGSALFTVAIVAGLVADLVYAQQALAGTYVSGSWVDAGWLLMYLLIGAAALHPSTALGEPATDKRDESSRWRIAVLAFVALLGPGALAIKGAVDGHAPVIEVFVGSSILFLLAFVRMGGLVGRLNERMRQLRESENERDRLLDKILSTSEDERRRLAIELHDGPIQHLTMVALQLELLRMDLHSEDLDAARSTADEFDSQLSTQISSLRELMSALRPPVLDERGLVLALSDQAAQIERASGIRCDVESTLSARLPQEAETVLFRIAQEGLANVVKHARATRASVILADSPHGWTMTITDNGRGFDVENSQRSGHLGLMAMQERADSIGGRFSIASSPLGTTLVVDLARVKVGV